jgi:hypothetical protein
MRKKSNQQKIQVIFFKKMIFVCMRRLKITIYLSILFLFFCQIIEKFINIFFKESYWLLWINNNSNYNLYL